MSDLHSRAAAFLRGPCIISEPGAGLIRLISRYADGELEDDPELRDVLSRGMAVARSAAAARDGDARLFYDRAAAILE